MITGIKEIIDAEVDSGATQYTWRKTPSQVSVTNIWYDLAVSPGNPTPKYWFDASPLVAQVVRQSTDGGFYHGKDANPSQKYLRSATFHCHNTGTTGLFKTLILCDYLLYYPSIDESTTDQQDMVNTNTLTRSTDGKGVQVMAVNLAARTGGSTFTFSYTNQDGVSGRTSQIARLNAYPSVGNIATCDIAQANQHAPFIGLQDGDYGIRSIESVTMLSSDVGLFALVLVRPLQRITGIGFQVASTNTVLVEQDFIMENTVIPTIDDDAFISAVGLPEQTGINTATITGNLKIVIV
jgi:hypothetical protein